LPVAGRGLGPKQSSKRFIQNCLDLLKFLGELGKNFIFRNKARKFIVKEPLCLLQKPDLREIANLFVEGTLESLFLKGEVVFFWRSISQIPQVRYIGKHEHIDKFKSQLSTTILRRLPKRPKVLLVYLQCEKRVKIIPKTFLIQPKKP